MVRRGGWLAQPDQFASITEFLSQRRLLRSAQKVMAGVSAAAATVPATVLTGPLETGSATILIGTAAAVFTAGMVVLWLTRWPTCRQSQTTVLIGTLSVAAWSLVQPSAAIAALTCTALAVTGGYIAFFHSDRLLLVNASVTVVVTVLVCVRLARDTDVSTALTAFWLIWFLNGSVPIAVRGMSRALLHYARRSDEDPLTGLLNRRGFVETATRRVVRPAPTDSHLTVLLVDLDDFKRVNDTFGHAAGDRALLDVAELLRQHTPSSAVLGRVGGEEFLIALTASGREVGATTAVSLCAAIAELPHGMTASIGTAHCELSELTPSTIADVIDRLSERADTAMYSAKRSGGNRVHHV